TPVGVVSATLQADGTLDLGFLADQNGVVRVTVRATDPGGLFAEDSFQVTVNPINDAPSFTKGADQTVLEDAGPQTVTGWATNISAGPANESTQVVDFIITNNTNAGLFSTPPAVSAAGDLTYTPAANANGTATISVKIHDNGGTSPGVHTSAAQTFNINVR